MYLEMNELGEAAVYPGHPVVVAYLIMKKFDTFEDASGKSPNCEYKNALVDNEIPGGGEVHMALDLVKHITEGEDINDLFDEFSERWERGMAGGHTERVKPGQEQAERIKGKFIQFAGEWLENQSKDKHQEMTP